jgi:CheY-like chemotaxis protein
LRNQSTAHVHRADVATRRASDWLKVAEAHAPAGFDDTRDALLIHRSGTVLYASALVPMLLGIEQTGPIAGSALMDLFDPTERERVARLLSQVGQGVVLSTARATLPPGPHRKTPLDVIARSARDASPPVDILYVCPNGGPGRASHGDERDMERRDAERLQGESRRVTVLICDDEAKLGVLTAGLLFEFGFAPVTVGNGDEAIKALGRTDLGVDVVLLDVNLSEGPSAKEVLAAMQDRGSHARVILTSGLAEEDVSADLLRHPFVVGYVPKPYGVDQLVQSVRTALAQERP